MKLKRLSWMVGVVGEEIKDIGSKMDSTASTASARWSIR